LFSKKIKLLGLHRWILGLIVLMLAFPLNAFANTSPTATETVGDTVVKENPVLAEVISEVSIGEDMKILKGSKLYISPLDEEEGLIQIGDEDFNVPLETIRFLEEEEKNLLQLEYKQYKPGKDGNYETISLLPDTPIYSLSTETEIANISKARTYPVLKEDAEKYYVIVGNTDGYINKKDLVESNSNSPTLNDPNQETPEEETSTELDDENGSKDGEHNLDSGSEDNSTDKNSSVEIAATSKSTQLTFSEAGYLQPSTPTLSVYDNSTGSLVKVGALVAGQSYPILETVGNWHRIKFGEKLGYVWKDSTTPSTGSEVQNLNNSEYSTLYQVSSETYLSVYDNTSGSLVKMGSISPDVKYPVISEAGNWLKISFAGRIGYIYKPATKIHYSASSSNNAEFFKITTPTLTVYDNSTGKLVKVGGLEKGQVYPIVSISGNWIQIKFGNGYGYVWKGSTIPVGHHSIKNLNKNLTNTDRTIFSNYYLSVYDNTSGELVRFGQINPNVDYPIIGQVGNWYKVDLAGRIGYVYEPATFMNFKSSDQYFKVKSPELAVFDNRSGSLEQVGYLKSGETFKRVADVGNWHRIEFGNFYGYVWEKDTTIGNPSEISAKATGYSKKRTFVSLQDLPVYDNSTGSLVEFATIQAGQTYPYESISGNWIKVDLGGRSGFVYKTGVQVGPLLTNGYSDYTFEEALDIQLSKAPQNDTTKYKAYIRSDAFDKIEGGFGYVNDTWNVRGGPGTSYWKLNSSSIMAANGPLIKNEKVQILGEEVVEVAPGVVEKWYQINFYKTYRLDNNGNYYNHYRAFVNASRADVAYYLDPTNFVEDPVAKFQFLLLSESANANPNKINSEMLVNKGNLTGKGAAFVEAGRVHNINEIYLISHSLLETGAGTSRESTLLKGYKVNKVNGNTVPERTVYNVYGIAAYDSCPGSPAICAAEFAYEQGWFSVEEAIIGGAEFIGQTYIHRESGQQNTLYEMRWNPNTPGVHQYATDVGWAVKQAVGYFSKYYSELGLEPRTFEIPVYK
jgi:mannosyl-glycoprotein endo-beta-N-acetylglucosaminidase